MDHIEPEQQTTFVVSRSLNDYRDLMRSYVVVLDGKQVGRVGKGEEVTVAIAPGRHVVRARIDWTGSPEIEFTVEAGGRAAFCVGAAGGPFRLDQMFSRGRYLTLERID